MKVAKPHNRNGTVEQKGFSEAASAITRHSSSWKDGADQKNFGDVFSMKITSEQEYLLNSKKLNYEI